MVGGPRARVLDRLVTAATTVVLGAFLRAGDTRGAPGTGGDNRGRLPRRPALVNRGVERGDRGEGSTLIEHLTVALGDAQNPLPGGAAHGEARHLRIVQAVPRRDVYGVVAHGRAIG